MHREITCPRCGTRVAIDLDQAPYRLQYNYHEWRQACLHQTAASLATCPEMIAPILEATARRKTNGNAHE